jgi:iron complex outermembrane receptor protein
MADIDAGYKFGDFGWIKSPTLKLNISNLTNEQYRSASSIQTNTLATQLVGTTTKSGTNTVFYYLGAPRLTSLTLSADFE